MAILEKKVRVTVCGRNSKYYEHKGYIVPKRKDGKNRVRIERGTQILVLIEDLPDGSNVKVTKICDKCDSQIKNQKYTSVLRSRASNGGADLCIKCTRIMSANTQSVNAPYKKSLEYYSLNNGKKHLLKEYSNKNNYPPSKIYAFSNKKYWWKCSSCDSEYDMPARDKIERGCPYCSGRRVNQTNCLWTTHPEIAKSLKEVELGYKITKGTNRKVMFKCGECNLVEPKKVWHTITQGYSCSRCSDKVSYPEKLMFNLLSQVGKFDFEWEWSAEWSQGKRYDFYIHGLNCIVEMHGGQHYKGWNGKQSVDEIQNNDRLKEVLANNNGIKYYIVIDCRKSELEWIKNNIKDSQLNELLDLGKVNWKESHKFAINSLVSVVCDLYNEGINIKEISKRLKLSDVTVRSYLNKSKSLGWNDYDGKKAISGNAPTREVVQVTLDNEFIKCFNSASEASRKTNVHTSGITKTCRGTSKTAGGYKWMYKEDYDKYIQEQNQKSQKTS